MSADVESVFEMDDDEAEGSEAGPAATTSTNVNRTIKIAKVVVNIGVGEGGEKLRRAEEVIRLVTGCQPVRTLSRTTNKDLGVRKEMPIGCMVTLRHETAVEFLKRAFWVKQNRIANYSFDPEGNFSFGIPDYTDFKGMKYDPDIGIFGMDICVALQRNGYRIAKRRRQSMKVPHRHRITRDEAYQFVREQFNVEVIEVEL